MKYCDQRVCMSVCLSVCLSVCSHISKTTRPNCTKFSTVVTRGFCCKLPGFVVDLILSHITANGPESDTRRMFRRVRRVAAPGTKSAVSDCGLFTFTARAAIKYVSRQCLDAIGRATERISGLYIPDLVVPTVCFWRTEFTWKML